MEESIRVFIVDDHDMVRAGLHRMLDMEQDIEVVGEASSAEEALRHVELLTPHVILMDIKMPNVNGLDATRHLKSRGLPGEVLVLSLYEEYLAQAVEAGASGYLVKDVKREELVEAIRRVARGDLVLGGSLGTTPEITERTIGYLRDLLRKTTSPPSQDVESRDTPDIQDMGPGDTEGYGIHSQTPSRDPVNQNGITGLGEADARQNGGDLDITSKTYIPTVRRRIGTSSYRMPIESTPRIPVVRKRINGHPKEDTLQVAPSPLSVLLGRNGDELQVPRTPDLEEVDTSLPRGIESGWLNSDDSAELFESDVELVVAPPVESHALLKLHQWLKAMLRVEVEETSGSWDGGTSLRVLLKQPTPLLKMLETIPEVVEAKEEFFDARGNDRRFLKRRKDLTRSPTTSPRRVRLVLDSPSSPRQLTLGLE